MIRLDLKCNSMNFLYNIFKWDYYRPYLPEFVGTV